ncbi:MAG: hypothetical protein WDW38_004018 [Sanguina aurantia]
MAAAAVKTLADDFESVRLLLPSAAGIASLRDNTTDRTTASALLYNSSPWSRLTPTDAAGRVSHIQAMYGRPGLPFAELDSIIFALIEHSMMPLLNHQQLPTWAEANRTAGGRSAAARLVSLHSLWLDGFVALLSAVIPQLRLLMRLPLGTRPHSRKPPAVQLWQLVVNNCHVLVLEVGKEWPLAHMQGNPAANAALAALLDLVLEVQRSDPGARAWSRLAGSLGDWEQYVRVISRAPPQCVYHFHAPDLPQSVAAARRALPATLVAAVFSVAGHQLRLELARDPRLDPVPVWDLSTIGVTWLLLDMVFLVVGQVAPGERKQLCRLLMGAAAREAARLALCACARYAPTLWLQHLTIPHTILNLLFACLDEGAVSSGSSGGGGGGAGGGRAGAQGREAPVTDTQLFRAMHRCSTLYPECTYSVNLYMQQDADVWSSSDPESQPPPASTYTAPSETKLLHLQRVSHHIAHHTHLLMKGHHAADSLRRQLQGMAPGPALTRLQQRWALAQQGAVPTLAASHSLQHLLCKTLIETNSTYPPVGSTPAPNPARSEQTAPVTRCPVRPSFFVTAGPTNYVNLKSLYDQRHPGHGLSRDEAIPYLQREELRRLRALLSPAHRRLQEWGSMPGAFHMIEASLRSASESTESRLGLAQVGLRLVEHGQAAHAVTARLLASVVSLASTLRKTRQSDLGGWAGAGGISAPGSLLVVQSEMTKESLRLAIIDVNLWAVEQGPLSQPVPGSALSVGTALRVQALAVMSLCLAHECNALARAVGGTRAVMELAPAAVPRRLHNDACHARLADITKRSLLQTGLGLGSLIPSSAAHRLQLAAMWDGFAVKHLDGRLLAGCSHLRCTNLAGVSEAALPTQLCGGCRRARYCSVACQRDAWVAGGAWVGVRQRGMGS